MTDQHYPNPHNTPPLPSLLESIGEQSPGTPGAPGAPGATPKQIRARKPARRRSVAQQARARRVSIAIGVSLALGGGAVGGAMAWSALRPIRVPDVASSPLPNILNFALLDANFNRLPVEERLRLVLELAVRMRSMSAGDSALMAAFAAGIAGEARRQLEENVRRLGVDMMTSYARGYADVPAHEREKYLENAAIEWQKMGEQLTGNQRDVTDEQRAAEMREQAERDAQRGRGGQLTREGAVSFFESMHRDVSQYASPNERARTARFIRDMTRHMRGRDLDTNQPKR